MSFQQTAYSFITTAYQNLHDVHPGFNPMQHHTTKAARPGDSFFIEKLQTVQDVLALLNEYIDNGSEWYAEPGKKQEVYFIIDMPIIIGTTIMSPPLPGEQYVVIKDHGGLIPSGKTQVSMVETTKLSCILTLERLKNETSCYALASVYPGEPDPSGSWEGLKEGDSISGEELLKRGISRVKQIDREAYGQSR